MLPELVERCAAGNSQVLCDFLQLIFREFCLVDVCMSFSWSACAVRLGRRRGDESTTHLTVESSRKPDLILSDVVRYISKGDTLSCLGFEENRADVWKIGVWLGVSRYGLKRKVLER